MSQQPADHSEQATIRAKRGQPKPATARQWHNATVIERWLACPDDYVYPMDRCDRNIMAEPIKTIARCSGLPGLPCNNPAEPGMIQCAKCDHLQAEVDTAAREQHEAAREDDESGV